MRTMRFFSRASVVGAVQTLLRSAASVGNDAGSTVDGTVAASWAAILADAACGARRSHSAFCWTHLRHRFFDIAKDGNGAIASEALERIAKLALRSK
jgi:hypothetical protein